MSDKSRHLLASIYTSPGFNLPGYPVAGASNLTPTVPSLAGSHHVPSTWPTGMVTSGPSSPHLTINQVNSIFKLAAECQVLGIKLAKQFQVLSGLEAMHHNSIQGMVHETLTLACSAWEATYSAILQDGVSKVEREAMTCCLHSEADAAWKEMNSAFSPIMSSCFHSLLVCGKVCVCSYTLGNVVRWYACSLLGSYVQQEYYVAVIQM